jgi:hypothetical protein
MKPGRPTCCFVDARHAVFVSPRCSFHCSTTAALQRDDCPVWPNRYLCLALPNEVEVDLETNRVGYTEQDRNARLLHLDVVEGERRRG